MKFSVKNLFLILSAITLSALASCEKQAPELAPEPDGQYRVTLSSDMTTRAFWPTDDVAQKQGEACERKINSVTMLVYRSTKNNSVDDLDTDNAVHRRDFTASEVNPGNNAAPSAIFSIPQLTDGTTHFDFYVIANLDIPTDNKKWYKRSDLLAMKQSDLQTYLKNNADIERTRKVDNKFVDIYSGTNGPTSDAVYRRTRTANDAFSADKQVGEGFVMVGSSIGIKKAEQGSNAPTRIEIPVDRVAAKFQVNISITDEFINNYSNPFGGRIRIDSIVIRNIKTESYLFDPEDPNTADIAYRVPDYNNFGGFNVIDNWQVPYTDSKSNPTEMNEWKYYGQFYAFENVHPSRTTSTGMDKEFQPQLYIVATYDADGNFEGEEDDKSKVTFTKDLLTSGNLNRQVRRNTYYRIEVLINGLSSEQAVATVDVQDWKIEFEKIELGS